MVFGVSFFGVITYLHFYLKGSVFQVCLQMNDHHLRTEMFQRLTAFQLELDDVSRERHEVIDVARMSEPHWEVPAADFIRSEISGYSVYVIAAPYFLLFRILFTFPS